MEILKNVRDYISVGFKFKVMESVGTYTFEALGGDITSERMLYLSEMELKIIRNYNINGIKCDKSVLEGWVDKHFLEEHMFTSPSNIENINRLILEKVLIGDFVEDCDGSYICNPVGIILVDTLTEK